MMIDTISSRVRLAVPQVTTFWPVSRVVMRSVNMCMVQAGNLRDVRPILSNAALTEAKTPLQHFFLERYAESFTTMLDDFHKVAAEGAPPFTAEDGRRAIETGL